VILYIVTDEFLILSICITVKGDTSTFECAHQLGKLCENRHLVVNLIPYNQTDVKDKLSCPSEEHMKEFQRIVTSYGAFCTIRRTMGADIAGACGQLVVAKEKKEQGKGNVGDIEDGPFVSNGERNSIVSGSKKAASYRTKRSQNLPSRSESESEEINKNTDMDGVPGENNLERWIKPLAYATGAAASVFALSLVVMVSQRRRR